MEELERYAVVIIAVWGAVISTILAAIKVRETIRDRRRIVINPRFCNDSQIGNTIAIHNKSSENLIITFWAIYQKRGSWPFSKRADLEMQEYDSGNLTIDAHSERELRLCGPKHFSISHKNRKKGNIYMSLYISGRNKPMKFRIYRFSRGIH